MPKLATTGAQLRHALAARENSRSVGIFEDHSHTATLKIDKADDHIDAEIVDVIEDVLVSLAFASWNQLVPLLRRIDQLR